MITIYSTTNCMKCKMTKDLFSKLGQDYNEVNIEEKPEVIPYIKEELGYSSLPIVVLDNGTHWNDFRVDKIRQAAKQLSSQG